MDETEREKEKRDVSNVSENKKKNQYNTFFTELRAMLQTHGYPVKGDRSKTSQGTTALSQKKEGTVNPETSRERSNWIPSFQSYEDFKCKTLQSLDGFMIILSTDGVIIFVAGNVTCLLGHLPNDLIGKKLLSLLPDNEKNEVYRKIALKLPLSSSVGKHIDFCCHFKRGDVEHSSSPTYEYVKFIITVKDISSEPLVLFSSFFPSHTYAESFPTYLPLEDRFYMVGSICLFKPQTLQELCAVNKAEDEVMLIQEDSNEEHVYPEYRIQGQRRSSRMESLRAAESVATAVSGDQASIVTAKQYGPQESVQIIKIQSDTSYNSSISSLESTAISPATSSLQSFELESSLEQIHDMDDADQMDEMEKMEQVDEEEEVEWMVEKKVEQKSQVDQMAKDDQLDQVKKEEQLDEMKKDEQLEQQALSPSTVAANTTDQLSQPPSAITSYINKRDLELMKKFREQLEEKTQMLQGNIKSQQDALEMVKEQLQRMQSSGFQMQPTTSHHLATPESQSLGPVPKKQRTEWMKGPFSDLKEFKLSSGSCSSRSFKCPEELQEPCNTLNQASLQTQDPYVQQQFQQVHERHTQQPQQRHTQQPQQRHTLLGNQTLQVHLQGQANVAVPLYEEPMTFMQTQPTVLPVQLVAGQQPSGYYQNETLRGTESNSHSLLPMEQQGVSRDPQPMVYNPSSITSFRRSPVNPESTLITLETPQDYIQLWQQPPDSQHHLYLQVNTWPSREQTTVQDQPTWPQQVAALEAGSEALQDPARYTPGQMSYFMSIEQSSLDQRQRQHQHQHQHQHQRYYRTEP